MFEGLNFLQEMANSLYILIIHDYTKLDTKSPVIGPSRVHCLWQAEEKVLGSTFCIGKIPVLKK